MFVKGKMNFTFVLASLMSFCALSSAGSVDTCKPGDPGIAGSCTAVYENRGNHLEIYTRHSIEQSFDFLFLSSTFKKYDLDRPGFNKLYRKISDKAWEDTIALIKYQSRRGWPVSLMRNISSIGQDNSNHDASELSSLQYALYYQKKMAMNALEIHRQFVHAGKERHDSDAAHYLDENIIEYQSGVVRDLAGYIHTLSNIGDGPGLGIHLFDEYLEKSL